MPQTSKYNKSYRASAMLVGLLIFCLSAFYIGRSGFSFGDYSKGQITRLWSTDLVGKLADFGRNITERLTIKLIDFTSPQLVKTTSSSPLSGINFKKTRPRGIPAQEPSCKFLSVSNFILIHPLDNRIFINTTPFLILSSPSGNTLNIRPPPHQWIKATGFPA
ncbi:MAG: hypothetical protein M0P47_12305 [Bacteroidales bacterium]|nr:hypothetical protein [Bacteroidales bacterium]